MEGAGKSGQEARLVEIDIMKFYGILLVVLGHVAMIYSPMSLIKPQVSSELMVRVHIYISQAVIHFRQRMCI